MIPTDDILKLKGLRGPSKCWLCEKEEESLILLFFDCNFAQQVWKQLLNQLIIDEKDLTWDRLVNCWLIWHKRKYATIPFIIAWFIWMERSKAKFDNAIQNVGKTARNSLSYLHKMIKRKKFLNVSKSCSSDKPDPIQVIRVYLETPQHPTVKINTDGSFTKNGAGVGGIYRNHLDMCLLYFYTPVMAFDATEIKLILVYWAINLANKANLYKLWLEVDSATVIHHLNHEEGSPWEGNQPANWLAQLGSHSKETDVAINPPSALQYLLQGDILEVPYFRLAYLDT
ncbi:uncharacterized protein LOC110036045 [Phalaenopsis equestris]|uniref:uncharacterized protein LOC110036045 n=1 Tax=Phalaenopsis equestris TaxID=78828 RepID=UPI0009E2EABC|nr:uncharacterized protein LOC110036045 [Phalaenopsis equestris]